MRAHAWAPSAVVYLAATAVLGRDLLAQLGTTIASDSGDPLLTAAILHWNAVRIPYSDAWWQFPIYHPTRDTLAFSEHLLGLSVIATPLAWATGSALATYNLTLLLTFPLCGLSMFALVYYLTRSAAGGFIAGLVYAFAPYRAASLPHIAVLASFWAPLALLGLHRFVDAAHPAAVAAPVLPGQPQHDTSDRSGGAGAPLGRTAAAGARRWLAPFAACWALQAASNWYMLVLFSAFVALWVLWFVIGRRRWRALGAIAAAIALAALPLLPIVYRYLTVHALHNFERSVLEMRAFSADVAAVLCATPTLTLWGRVRVFCRAEGELFPGVALTVLFVAGLVIALRRGRGDAFRRGWNGRVLRILPWTLLAVTVLYTAVVLSFLAVGPWRFPLLGISVSGFDKPLLIALAAGVLALLIALAPHAWRSSTSASSFYLFAAIVSWLLALGPTVTLFGESSGRPGPFALLQFLPGVSGLRVPARFWLMAVLSLAVVAGYVTAHLVARRRRIPKPVLVSGLAMALLGDGWMAGIPAHPSPPSLPDPGALRDRIVLHLPVEPYPDIAATWWAVTGGWKSVNGYSGYTPNYYTALAVAARTGDAEMFAPFRRDNDLDVVVGDRDGELQAWAEGQPGVVVVARASGFAHYRLLRQPDAAPPHTRVIPLGGLHSSCAGQTVDLARDGDERTGWACLEDAGSHGLIADVGTPRLVAAIVYSVGPYSWNVPTQLAVDTSLDGTDWRTVSSASVLRALIEGGLDNPSALRATVRFPVHEARYLRVRPVNQPADFAWFVTEIEVRGPQSERN